MKKCIWCKRHEGETSFKTKAHTIPESLGGVYICENVCDECNHYFGTHQNQKPPIDNVIKETFNISRARFLNATNNFGKNKSMARFKSLYFDVNFKKGEIKAKAAYQLKKGFQKNLARQLKKGVYKIFLEEQERQNYIGQNSNFDFIREFARFDNGDYPLLYFERKIGLIPMATDWAKKPEFIINSDFQLNYLFCNKFFFEFEFLGHVFGIPICENWEPHISDYLEISTSLKSQFFKRVIFVEHFQDIDFTLRILNN